MFFTASSCFFQNRFVQRLIRLVSAVLWGAAVSLPLAFIAYWLSHDGLMNADTLIAIWQTNPSEAVEYFSYKGAMFTVGVCIFAVLLTAISIRALTCRQSIGIFSRAVPVISVIMLATSIAAAMKNAGNLTTNIVTAAVEKVQELNSFESKLEERKSLIASLEGIREQGRHGLYVVIVGESQTRDRMSAYGYEKETTPWLTRQAVDDHFVLMQNAYSCYPNTVRSLEQALTARSQFTDRPLAESPSIVEIARAAGYHVSWLSNQNRLGGWDSPTTVIANEAVIPKYARNPKAASYFINFMCRPDIAIRNMDACGYVSSIASPEIMEEKIDTTLTYYSDLSYFFGSGADSIEINRIQYPDRSVVERCAMIRDFGDKTKEVLEIWSRIKGDNLGVGITILIFVVVGVMSGWMIYKRIQRYQRKKLQRRRSRRKKNQKSL